ncbi:MAG: CarD family transcriptional regulator [Treponema sp.]|jgi:CarD family transcriptional regulator|nr:CarD family transcriptional regulator [Treponema sp.]
MSVNFQIDQRVVYPCQGVGKILSIEDKKFKNETIPYYVIYLEVSDMMVMVPVAKAEELKIRAIVAQDVAQQALQVLGEDYEPIPSDWKQRYEMNLALSKKGSIIDNAIVVRALYHRSKVKELPIQERKLYDSTLKLLEDELSLSLGESKEAVDTMILARLNSHL